MNNELKTKSIEEMKEELKRISDFDKIKLINAILFSNIPLFLRTESNNMLIYLIKQWGYDCNVINLRKETDDTIKNELPNWYIKLSCSPLATFFSWFTSSKPIAILHSFNSLEDICLLA